MENLGCNNLNFLENRLSKFDSKIDELQKVYLNTKNRFTVEKIAIFQRLRDSYRIKIQVLKQNKDNGIDTRHLRVA